MYGRATSVQRFVASKICSSGLNFFPVGEQLACEKCENLLTCSLSTLTMTSLFRWLAKANPGMSSKIPAAKTPLLPDPNEEKSITDRSVTASANVEIS